MWGTILLSLVILSVLGVLAFNLGSLVLASFKGAPFVPSGSTAIDHMLTLAAVSSGLRVAELGSGDGRVVRAFAVQGAIVDGYEIQPLLVWWSRWLNRLRGLSGRARILRQNLYSAQFCNYDVIVIYGFPNMMPRIAQKCRTEMKPGSKIISHAFPIKEWEAVRQLDNVYLYEI